mmetsp:Transcript_13266/g.27838  ORF Transcript_13266/g.27838 Transcript_13266/m.27838 type:complete len:413 (-) Transcript_13266:19-1257(-)
MATLLMSKSTPIIDQEYISTMNNKMNLIDLPATPEFTSYDVLLMPSSQESEPPAQIRFAPGNHVGNQRFLVLLDIYRERFLLADMLNNVTERRNISLEVMNTVAFSCTPNGRFFEQSTPLDWRELTLGPEVLDIINSALKAPPLISPSYPSPASRYAPVARKRSGDESLRADPFERGQDDVNDSKARRTSVLSMLCNAAQTTEDIVVSPDPFDVICEPDGTIKQSGHAGNNRLKVMYDIRMGTFENSDQEGKRKITQEIVSSIIDDASSRFLQKDMSTGMYKQLDREVAFIFVRNSLSSASGVQRQLRASAIKRLIDRKQKKDLLDKLEHRKSIESIDSNDPPPTTFKALNRSSVLSHDSHSGHKRRSTLSHDSQNSSKRPSLMPLASSAPPAMDSPETPDMKQKKCTAHAA